MTPVLVSFATAPANVHGGYHAEELVPGMSALYTRTVTDNDILLFATVSGDGNPVHLDDRYAAATAFKGRVAHGMLTASHISAALSAKLPGPGCIYLSQTLKFKAPVRPGDTVHTRVTVTDVVPNQRKATLATVCTVKGRIVLEGEALVLVPSRETASKEYPESAPACA